MPDEDATSTQSENRPQEGRWPWQKRRQSPFYAAGLVACLSLAAALATAPYLAVEVAAIAFYLTYLAIMARRISRLTADRLLNSPERDDEPAFVILLVTLATIAAAVLALFNAMNRSGSPDAFEVALAFFSVIGGWLTIHTMFAMHYADRFWRHEPDADGRPQKHEGLDFPETEEPSGWEFLYFSFVIGMTAQTSDVAITTTSMRRINLLHAVVSFFFNTVLVAAAVNAVVSMGQ